MILDVTPIEINPTDWQDKVCKEYRNECYVIKFSNSKNNFSVHWTKERLIEFLKDRTISEMIQKWNNEIKADQLERFQRILENTKKRNKITCNLTIDRFDEWFNQTKEAYNNYCTCGDLKLYKII